MEWIINGFLLYLGFMLFHLFAVIAIMLCLVIVYVFLLFYEYIKNFVYSVKKRIYEKSLTDRN